MIPRIDIAPLFGPESRARAEADRAILEAATGPGFMTVTGLPEWIPTGAAARDPLMRFFDLPEARLRALARRKFAPENPNIYRGYFPPQEGDATYKRGIELGPDIREDRAGDPADPLQEPTPLPEEEALPGWRAEAAAYHAAMTELGQALMRAMARALGLEERRFDEPFENGISTLRLLHFPKRPEAVVAAMPAEQRLADGRILANRAHTDSGFVTLLSQGAVGGLQARGPDGAWLDVPAEEDSLAVNFGELLSRWTGGLIKATEHRVASHNVERTSVPFFYEPAVDAVIQPLGLEGTPAFEPFSYGDHLWASITQFVEFRGMEELRPPRGVKPAA